MIKHLLAYQWLLANEDTYNQPKPLLDRKERYFEVYNLLTGSNKKPTGCGRCLSGMRGTMRALKRNYITMEAYKVYRTVKAGTLTFKANGESVMTIHANSELTAKEALLGLKTYEKNQNKSISTEIGRA